LSDGGDGKVVEVLSVYLIYTGTKVQILTQNTKVQILTQKALEALSVYLIYTGTKVRILTQKALLGPGGRAAEPWVQEYKY
jgi:hypothetical protein